MSYQKEYKLAALTAGLAIAFALSFLFMKTLNPGTGPKASSILNMRIGYWVWIASMGLSLMSSLVAMKIPK